jgi:hypothetical protein
MARCAGVLKKLVLFESKENIGAFSTCLGSGNEPCQKEIRDLLGEHAAFFMRLTVNLHNIERRYRKVDIVFDIVFDIEFDIVFDIEFDIVLQYFDIEFDIVLQYFDIEFDIV